MIRKFLVAVSVAIVVMTAGLAVALPPSGGNSVTARLAALESAVAGILQRLGVLETADTTQDARLSALESTVAAQATTIGSLQSDLASVQAIASDHETRLLNLESVTLTVPFETPVDLETGQLCPGPSCSGAPFDFTFAFNSTRANPTVVVQDQESGAQLALLIGTPYASVSSTAGLVFTPSIINVPFGPNDTAVIKTADGHYFKIGQAVCSVNGNPTYPGCTGTGDPGVTFRFTQIH